MSTLRLTLRRGLLMAVGLFALMQLARPARTNPPTDATQRLSAHVAVPADVSAILERSCGDCHSHDTRWPWYSGVAPVSWLVVDDVNEGREHFNVATWGTLNREDRRESLEEICKQVRKGDMPMGVYVNMHPEAALSRQDVDTLCGWSAATLAATRSTER